MGVAVPAEPRLVTLLDELGQLRADLKPVEPENLHFTLSFLGEIAESARPDIDDALQDATRGAAPFALGLQGVGAFPSARRPRVVWAGVADPRPVSELAVRVRAALAARGLPQDEKGFRAHLTLARVRSERGADEVAAFVRRHGQDALPDVAVREVILYRSAPGPRGPTYTALARAPLEA